MILHPVWEGPWHPQASSLWPHNTETVSFPLSNSLFLRYNKQQNSRHIPQRTNVLRVYDSRDNSWKTTPSPPLSYSLTHAHRSIGYHNIPQSLVESVVRLMELRVYDRRDSSCNTTPSPSLWYSITHAHRSIGYHNTLCVRGYYLLNL